MTVIKKTPQGLQLGKPGKHDRRFSRGLAQVAREQCPPDILVEYCLAILEGHGDAVMKRDSRFESGWTVTWPESGGASTPEHKQWAWTQLRQAGYGMPVQSIQLEAEMRAHVTTDAPADLGALDPALRATLLEGFRGIRDKIAPTPAALPDRPAQAILDVVANAVDANPASAIDQPTPAGTVQIASDPSDTDK